MAFLAALPAWLTTAVSVGTTLVGAISTSNQYKAAADADKYNAAVAHQKATAASAAGNQREEQQRRAARLAAGERRAAIAQSGSGLGGSNADVDRQSEILAELDALNIRYEYQSDRVGLLNQGALYDASAKSNKSAAKSALVRGALGAATTALTSKW